MSFVFMFMITYQICLSNGDILNSAQDVIYSNDFEGISSKENRRVRRATYIFSANVSYTCDTSGLPQPTERYPAILFEKENFNGCNASGKFTRIPANVFVKWGENGEGVQRGRILKWWSMLVLPDLNVTFRACCPSGNDFMVTVTDWQTTPNMNLSVITHPILKGSKGIWYERWTHWKMNFDVRIDLPLNNASIPSCSKTCYSGECGVTGNCECAVGYTGSQCKTRLTDTAFPSEEKPLVLFSNYDFEGTPVQANVSTLVKFAANENGARVLYYKSMRVLFNREVVFARNVDYTHKWSPGSDIRNISEFMSANVNVANPLWYNYDRNYDAEFAVKVVGIGSCENCTTHGSCYSGSCVCFPGFTGVDCNAAE